MGALEIARRVSCCLTKLNIKLGKRGPPSSLELSEEHGDSGLHGGARVCAREIPVLIRVVVVIVKFKATLTKTSVKPV